MSAARGPERLVRKFLVHATGCAFASMLASRAGGLLWLTIDDPVGEDTAATLNAFFDAAAEELKVGVAVFPALRSSEDVAGLVAALMADERWEVRERRWKAHERADAFLVWMRWTTRVTKADGQRERTSVMGFGPLGTMPAHRRAPFFALAAWPAGRENEHNEGTAPTVGFLDIKLPGDVTREKYASLLETTNTAVTAMKATPPEGAAEHDVTFCLPTSVRSIVFTPAGCASTPPCRKSRKG